MKRVGAIVVTTDKGLCGGLNTNVLRLVLNQHKEWRAKGIEVDYCAIGNKGLGFLGRLGANVVSQVVQLGDRPRLDKLVGPVKVLLDKYVDGTIDEVHIFFTTFINTMKQEARHGNMLPIPEEFRAPARARCARRTPPAGRGTTSTSRTRRSCSTACCGAMPRRSCSRWSTRTWPPSSRRGWSRCARRPTTPATIIDELQLIYNKTRQAAITKELAEIVGGAAAV